MKTIIFDLDGTLIDSLPDVQIAMNCALGKFGYPAIARNVLQAMVGGGALPLAEKAVRFVNGNPLHAPDLSEEFKTYYSTHPVVQTTVFPNVRNTLSILLERNYKLGICTNKPEATTYPVLDSLELGPYFSAIICGDSRFYKKPDARHLWDVIAELGGDIDTSIYIGDSETDVAAARNAKVPIVLVSFGYAQSRVASLGADSLIDDFNELPDLIAKSMEGV